MASASFSLAFLISTEIVKKLIAEIKKEELISKNLSKYIAFFEYLDKSLFD